MRRETVSPPSASTEPNRDHGALYVSIRRAQKIMKRYKYVARACDII